jgi:aminoglycoside phosphotransferase (APT) family kinase protein
MSVIEDGAATEPDGSRIGEDQVRALLAEQFPEHGGAIALLGEGWASRAFLVGDDWIFRFPKRAQVERRLEIELALLPELASSLTAAVPRFELVGAPGHGYPFRFAGYRRLPGEPALGRCDVDAEAIGTQIGGLLASLHAFPTGRALALGVTDESAHDHPARVVRDALEALRRLGDTIPADAAIRCRDVLREVPPPSAGASVLAHRDLHAEHVCLDGQRVVGILDWGDVAVTDPAADFAAIKWLGRPFLGAALAAYRRAGRSDPDAGFIGRAALIALRFALWDIGFGLANGRRAYVEAGLAGIGHACDVMAAET